MAIFVRHLLIMDLAGCELLGVLHLGLSLCKAARGLVYCGLGWGGGDNWLGFNEGHISTTRDFTHGQAEQRSIVHQFLSYGKLSTTVLYWVALDLLYTRHLLSRTIET
jgi:hypothetical protein